MRDFTTTTRPIGKNMNKNIMIKLSLMLTNKNGKTTRKNGTLDFH